MMLGKCRQSWKIIVEALDKSSLWLVNQDERFLQSISNSRLLNRFSKVLLMATYFGDGYLWGFVGLYLILFGGARAHNYVLIGLAISIVNITAFRLVKTTLGRPRPLFQPKSFKMRFRVVDDFSFPSGHATIAFGVAYTIMQAYTHLWWAWLGVYLASALIGISRIFVQEHYPSDVLGGALIGTFVSAALMPYFESIVF